MAKKTICIDFDGVIHRYDSPWTTHEEIADGPVDGAIAFIKEMLADGYDVAIHSSRSHSDGGTLAMCKWFHEHLRKTETESYIEVFMNLVKFPLYKPPALIYIDDRGYRFEGKFPTVADIERKPWNKQET